MGATAKDVSPSKASSSRRKRGASKIPIEQYEHPKSKRKNNPPVGLVDGKSDQDGDSTRYFYDPHLDPTLNWTGKAERSFVEVPTVSLHVHERMDPRSIIEAVRKTNTVDYEQISMFNKKDQQKPLHEEIQFYRHNRNWSNRLVAGDSLLVMNSLIEKEGMSGKFQMVYIDPPYGIKYGSNFQPFVHKKEVKDGSDDDLSKEPETIKAFRDTWELGIHSYLSYLRDRLLLAKEMLHESGSVFVQIGEENEHLVRSLMSEIFGSQNFIANILYRTTTSFSGNYLSSVCDYIIWFGKDKKQTKYNALYTFKSPNADSGYGYNKVELSDGRRRSLTKEEKQDLSKLPKGARLYRVGDIRSQGATKSPQEFEFEGRKYLPGANAHWKTTLEGMDRLKRAGRIERLGSGIGYVRYFDDFPVSPLANYWHDTANSYREKKIYTVQTSSTVIKRCMLMTTDPGDLVFDPTAGSGTTAYVAEKYGRRWITCDTSRVSITLVKKRLATAVFDYYQLAHPNEGVDSGFIYEEVPHVTLASIAKGEKSKVEHLLDRPVVDNTKSRVSGPFTVEAVPAPVVKPAGEIDWDDDEPSTAIVRSGETSRQNEWREALLGSGIRGKDKKNFTFSRLEPLPGTRWLHVIGETNEAKPRTTVVSFGPEHAPLESRHVSLAIEEAQKLVPSPELLLFAGFQFDPEAAKEIDELKWPGKTVLKVQMNPDLLVGDLKKKTVSESFWLMGQPDIRLKALNSGENKGCYQVELNGFDYYNPKTGEIESGSAKNIAMWSLDTDYDGRSLFPRQVFFPLGGKDDGWEKLAKTLKTEIDEELIEKYRGTVSIPFEKGKYGRVAVKIVDDRGIESLRIVELENEWK